MNSWCILGALMCKLHFEIAGWHHLWASLAHTRTALIDLAALPSPLKYPSNRSHVPHGEEMQEATEEHTSILYTAVVLS